MDEQEIKDMFREDFREDYLRALQDEHESGKIISMVELLWMAYARGVLSITEKNAN